MHGRRVPFDAWLHVDAAYDMYQYMIEDEIHYALH